jgi:hypothetical protein
MSFLTERDVSDIPCISCNRSDECAKKRLECVAVRNYYYTGNYNEKDKQRLLRPYKVL